MANKLQAVYWVAGQYAPLLYSVMVQVTPKVIRIPPDRQLLGVALPGGGYEVRVDAGVVWFGIIEAWEAFVEDVRSWDKSGTGTFVEIAENAFEDYKAKRESDFDGEEDS